MKNLSKNSIKRTLHVISQKIDHLDSDARLNLRNYIFQQTEKLINIKHFERCFGFEGLRKGNGYYRIGRKYPKVVHKIIDIRKN